ncbi:MAG TPA: trehalose-6-phosphate synthase, partial [Gemmatimonadales bacterium]|nr:trehalose-6-phosphate synthase [Gemmatimonadales bacterium]
LMALTDLFRRRSTPPLILVSNREPFVHRRSKDGRIDLETPAGGLTSALQPVMAAAGGTWVAWGSGSADFDVTGPDDTVAVPPSNPSYTLRRLRLSDAEVQGFYVEAANRSLWPLCHSQLSRFVFDAAHWQCYKEVNERFATAAIAVARGTNAICWIQDYQLALVPGVLRKVRQLFVHQFWHIPWPQADILRTLPTARSLVQALLGNHLLEFQTAGDVRNFLMSVRRFVKDAVVEPSKGLVRYKGRRTVVKAFPISIDVTSFEAIAREPETEVVARRVRREALPGDGQLLLGVERVDYTKGIPRRFYAVARLLEERPELRGKVTLLQVAVPSRSDVPEYAAYDQEVVDLAAEINTRYGRGEWVPIRLIRHSLDQATLVAYYRAADVCIVSPLQDGMNLVAKEFVASQEGRFGVLVLSRFAGAAREMKEALLVNPYDIGATSETLHRAIRMPVEERTRRLTMLRRRLSRNTIQDWMEDIFAEVGRLRRSE